MLKLIKERLNFKRLYQSEYLPLYVLILIELLLHITMGAYLGDDIKNTARLGSLVDYFALCKDIVWNWSSRIIIEPMYFLLLMIIKAIGDWIWAVLDVLMIWLLLWSISENLFSKNKRFCNFILTCVFCLYPYSHMVSAGWVATTLNYMWPAALGMYGCTLIKRTINEEKISLFNYITCLLATICACDSEQLSVIILVLTIASLGYCLKHKKCAYGLWMMTGIAIIHIIFHLFSGGNQSRLLSEIASYYPGFIMLSTVEKLQLGFSETLSQFIFAPNMVYMLLVSLLCWMVWHKNVGILNRVATAMPLLFSAAYGFLPQVTSEFFPGLWSLPSVTLHDATVNATPPYSGPSASLVTLNNYGDIYSYLPLVVMLMSFFVIIIGLFLAIDNPWKAMMAVLIFCCGVGSGMIMGFAPSIYESGARPYLYTYISFIVLIVMLIHENYNLFTNDIKKYFASALASVSSISLFAQAAEFIALYLKMRVY